MAVSTTILPRLRGTGMLRHARLFLGACRDAVQSATREWMAIERLQEYSDDRLRDIGLTRSGIEAAVRGLDRNRRG